MATSRPAAAGTFRIEAGLCSTSFVLRLVRPGLVATTVPSRSEDTRELSAASCASSSAPSMVLVLEGDLNPLWPRPYARPRALTPQSARLTLISVRVEP